MIVPLGTLRSNSGTFEAMLGLPTFQDRLDTLRRAVMGDMEENLDKQEVCLLKVSPNPAESP